MAKAAPPKPMITIKLKDKVTDISYHMGDFFAVIERGELYSIGELTLYGQGFTGLDPSNF